MSRFLSERVKNISPYTPGEQPRDQVYIKLNTNENPYGPSPKVLAAMKENINDRLRLYPDPESHEVRETIATYYGVTKNNVFLGNGSDEILALAFMAFYQDGKVAFPEISYSFYPVYCKLFNIEYDLVAMEKLKIDTKLFMNVNKGVVIANPNAPTGELIPLSQIEEILKSNTNHVVLIDEAYIDFGGESAVSLIKQYDNLLVVQTLSKSRSLAGARFGMAFASEEIIDGLNRVKNSFNSYPIDAITQKAVKASFEDESYFKNTCQKIKDSREKTVKALEELNFKVLPSKANFIFASSPQIDGKSLYLQLKKRGILVRYFNMDKINNYVRITIGTKEEMEQLILAVEKILNC